MTKYRRRYSRLPFPRELACEAFFLDLVMKWLKKIQNKSNLNSDYHSWPWEIRREMILMLKGVEIDLQSPNFIDLIPAGEMSGEDDSSAHGESSSKAGPSNAEA